MKLVRFDGPGVAVMDEGDRGTTWTRIRPWTAQRCCMCDSMKLPGAAMWSSVHPGDSRMLCDWCVRKSLLCSCGSFKGFRDHCGICGGKVTDDTD